MIVVYMHLQRAERYDQYLNWSNKHGSAVAPYNAKLSVNRTALVEY